MHACTFNLSSPSLSLITITIIIIIIIIIIIVVVVVFVLVRIPLVRTHILTHQRHETVAAALNGVSSSSSAPSPVSAPPPAGEVAKIVGGLRPFKPAETAAEKAPTSGYIGDIHSPTLRWEQNDENLDVTVYLPVTTWIRQKDQLNCDFSEDGFILYKGAQITENILHKVNVGGKILPRHCGWEWYYNNPYQVKINMYKAKDSRELWNSPILTPPGEEEGRR